MTGIDWISYLILISFFLVKIPDILPYVAPCMGSRHAKKGRKREEKSLYSEPFS